MPAIASAQTLLDSVRTVRDVVDALFPVIIGLAVLAFFFGLARYVFNAGDEEKKKDGRSIMWWGVIALFVMVAVWGIIRTFQNSFGLQNTQPPTITLPSVVK